MADIGKAIGAGLLGGAVGAAKTQLDILKEEASEARQARLLGLQEQSQKSLLDYTNDINQNNRLVGYGSDGREITQRMLKENPELATGMLSKMEYEKQAADAIYTRDRLDKVEDRDVQIQAQKDIERMKIKANKTGETLPKGFDEVYKANLTAMIENAPEGTSLPDIMASARQATYDAFGYNTHQIEAVESGEPTEAKEPEFDKERLKTVVRRAMSGNQGAIEELSIASQNLQKLYGPERAAEILNEAKPQGVLDNTSQQSPEFKQPFVRKGGKTNTVMSYEDLKSLFDAENPKRPKNMTAQAWNLKRDKWILDQQRQQQQ